MDILVCAIVCANWRRFYVLLL